MWLSWKIISGFVSVTTGLYKALKSIFRGDRGGIRVKVVDDLVNDIFQ